MSIENKELEALREVASSCRACPLNQPPYNPGKLVFGVGSSNPRVVFVGEGPGEKEALTGLPFVGPAGQLLQRSLRQHGYTMSDIYVLNVVKHRPPGNRAPSVAEARICGSKFLVQQLKILKPKYIVALGKVAAGALAILSDEPVALPKKGLRGLQFAASYGPDVFPVFCTWHPAYCLRNESAIPQLLADLQEVLQRVRKLEILLGESDGNS